MRKFHKYFASAAIFLSKKISAGPDNDTYYDGEDIVYGDPEILWDDICFIENTHEVWTHGVIWCSGADEIVMATPTEEAEALQDIIAGFV